MAYAENISCGSPQDGVEFQRFPKLSNEKLIFKKFQLFLNIVLKFSLMIRTLLKPAIILYCCIQFTLYLHFTQEHP